MLIHVDVDVDIRLLRLLRGCSFIVVWQVARMEASVVAERASREEAEQGLERALSAKGKLERFLEGVLRVRAKTQEKEVGSR